MPSTNFGKSGLQFFIAVLVGLAVLRVALALVPLPRGIELSASLLVTVIFVALPILALYRAAAFAWSARIAVTFVVAGVILHLGGAYIASQLFLYRGVGGVVFNALKDTGLVCWCVGLGALLAALLKDKNLLVPVSVFLAGFDLFLVLNPTGPVQQFIVKRPEIAKAALYSAPRVATEPGLVRVESLAYVGPADFLFLAMFFVALFKFQMRTQETLRWIVPVLLCYLVTVVVFGGLSIGPVSLGSLPALVPIGATVLLVNRREFNMTRQETASTWVIVAISVALASLGLKLALDKRPAPPSVPSIPAGAQVTRESAAMPSQV